MLVLQVHNYYQIAGGEDTVVAQERDMLEANGIEVVQWTVSNDGIRSAGERLRAALRAGYSHRSRRRLAEQLDRVRPDLVHVHNFFPLLTPSIYDACAQAHVPVVQTLHNFRPICAGAVLWRDGEVCEQCIGRSSLPAVWHKCYRQSRVGSAVVGHMVDRHRRSKTWHTKVSRFITPSEFARRKFIEAGFPAERIVAKPNFVQMRVQEPASPATREGALYVGRLTPEKGVATMMSAWAMKPGVQLKVLGDGPLLEQLRAQQPAGVALLGPQPPERVAREMRAAAFLVMPSEWYETFGMTIVEAFRAELPVIASNIGAVVELVRDGDTGVLFNAGDPADLAAKVAWAIRHPHALATMAERARALFEERYTPQQNFRLLIDVYHAALTGRSAHSLLD